MNQSTEVTTATERLIQRMLSFDTKAMPFDGYPSMSCLDEELIYCAERESLCAQDPVAPRNPVGYMAYLASERATSKEQVRNALRFIDEFVSATIVCNFHESGNQTSEWYDEINDEPYCP